MKEIGKERKKEDGNKRGYLVKAVGAGGGGGGGRGIGSFGVGKGRGLKFFPGGGGDLTISNPEASQINLAIISHLLALKFSNLSMRLSDRERVHLGDSKFPQFAPRDVPDLSYESFLLSQILEVGQK
ncbi:hypothetical protein Tco_0317332 [Tanacetum coccineum]